MPNIQFQVRRGTASTWTSTNPTLANGEFGFETDTRQLKIGNNVAWNVLPYLNIGQAANWSAFPAYQTVDMSANILNNVGSIRNGAGTVSTPSYTFFNDVSLGLYDPSTNVLGIVTSGVERMRVLANGNIGIGTTSPQGPLDVSGSSPQITVYSGGTLASNGLSLFQNTGVGVQGLFSSNSLPINFYTSNAERMSILANGNVSISNDTTFNSNVIVNSGNVQGRFRGTYINAGDFPSDLYLSANVTYSITAVGTVQSSAYGTSAIILGSGQGSGTLRFLTGSNNTVPTEKMRIMTNGKVGIMCNSPQQFLDVGAAQTGYSGTYWGFGLNEGIANRAPSGYSIQASSNIIATGFYAYSDERIKMNIIDLSDEECIQQVRLIQPKRYEYIDKVERSSNIVYGFIAQQVRTVIPHAVRLQESVVPDIQDMGDLSNNIVTLRTKTFSFNDTSGNVRIITSDPTKSVESYPVSYISSNQFRLDCSFIDVSDVFVYGRKVDDFHTLDKDVIFTINVAATQELDRQLQAAKDKIQSLENRLSMLENR